MTLACPLSSTLMLSNGSTGDPVYGSDNEWAFGAGLYNTFRLSDRFVATLDLRHFSTASRYKTKDGYRTSHFGAFIGAAYNIYRTYWNRAKSIINENTVNKAEAEAAAKALQNANAERDALAIDFANFSALVQDSVSGK